MKTVQVRPERPIGQEDFKQKFEVSFHQKDKVSSDQKFKVSFDRKDKVSSDPKFYVHLGAKKLGAKSLKLISSIANGDSAR